MREQSRKLIVMLATIVDSLDRFGEMTPVLRELGARHVKYGVKPEHYKTLSSALLWAFGKALERDYYPEVRTAWTAAIDAINREMLSGADAAARAPRAGPGS